MAAVMSKRWNWVGALVLLGAIAACDRKTENDQTEVQLEAQRRDSVQAQYVQDSLQAAYRQDSLTQAEAGAAARAARPKTVEQSLKEDARLARTQSVERFTRHMKSRTAYYRQFKEVKYEDEYVKIKMEGDDWKIETPNGKAKVDEDETKIKTDTYKRKSERK